LSAFAELFRQLRSIMLSAARDQIVVKDEPGDLILHSRRIDPKTGKAEWFGAVTMKKSYVSYHLFPLYTKPSLGEDLSVELTRRRQGKSCFNFKKESPDAFSDLASLTAAAAKEQAERE
jgi:DNA-binding transcriptional ArsR family regulator